MKKKILLYCILIVLPFNLWAQDYPDGTSMALWKSPSVADFIDAKAIGAQLCIENLPRTCLGNTPEELLRIVENY